MKLSQRTQYFTESIIRKMTRICLEYNALNLSQGFPDFDPPQALMQSLAHVGLNGPHQYAITSGAPNFKAALAQKQSHFMNLPLSPDNIVVTCGSTEAMMASMLCVTNPGDKVIVFSPFYENYGADAILSGAVPLFVPLKPPHFNFDSNALEEAFAQKPKALILCNPSNPSGKVFSLDELQLIATLAQKHDAFIITDEVYEHIVFPPHKHHYIAALPNMFERTLSCSSLSKTYSITGWRLGYVIASLDIIERVHKVHDFLTVGAAAPLQEAALAGLRFPLEYYENLQKQYTQKRDLFISGLQNLGIPCPIPQGAYFVMLDISELGWSDDVAFCIELAKRVGIGAVPGSSFFDDKNPNYIRLHFAKQESTLIEALNRLENMKAKMRR